MPMIIQGPAGRSEARSPAEVRAQLERQWAKRDDVLGAAITAGLEEIGARGAENIRTRTEGGRDYRGAPFGAYSPEYAAWKGAGLHSVNLKLTGQMLGSIRHRKIGPRRVEITAESERIKGQIRGLARGRWPVYGKWTKMQRPQRRIMGFNASELEALQNKGFRAFQRIFRRGMTHG